MKRNVIIINKDVKYELTDDLPSDVSPVPSLLPKIKILLAIAKNH